MIESVQGGTTGEADTGGLTRRGRKVQDKGFERIRRRRGWDEGSSPQSSPVAQTLCSL